MLNNYADFYRCRSAYKWRSCIDLLYLWLCHLRMWISLRFAVPSFSVPSYQCVAPTLDYNAQTTPGSDGIVHIYTTPPFTSCSGRVVGYWFCYSTTGERVNIATVLLLEDMGANYQVVGELNVEVIPGRDRCLSGSPTDGQCCVTRNLSSEKQFGVNSTYLYGVVDLPGGPNMRQTHLSVGRPGYLLTTAVYTQSGGTLRKSGNPTNQPLKMFQFIVGKLTLILHLVITNESNYVRSLVFQAIALLIQLLPQHPPLTNIPSTDDISSIFTDQTFSSSTTSHTLSTSNPTPPSSPSASSAVSHIVS